jgi:hypothetical protein
LHSGNITLTDASGNQVPLTYQAVSADDTMVIFTLASPLASNTVYTVRVSKNVRDMNGNLLGEDKTSVFTTGSGVFAVLAAPYPANGAENIGLNPQFELHLSTSMNPKTINTDTVLLAVIDEDSLRPLFMPLELKGFNDDNSVAIFKLASEALLPKNSIVDLIIVPNKIQSVDGNVMDPDEDSEVVAEFHTQNY